MNKYLYRYLVIYTDRTLYALTPAVLGLDSTQQLSLTCLLPTTGAFLSRIALSWLTRALCRAAGFTLRGL